VEKSVFSSMLTSSFVTSSGDSSVPRQSRKIADRHGVVSSGDLFEIRSKKWCWVVEFLRKLRMKTAYSLGNAS
jgi:hypothetical protein